MLHYITCRHMHTWGYIHTTFVPISPSPTEAWSAHCAILKVCVAGLRREGVLVACSKRVVRCSAHHTSLQFFTCLVLGQPCHFCLSLESAGNGERDTGEREKGEGERARARAITPHERAGVSSSSPFLWLLVKVGFFFFLFSEGISRIFLERCRSTDRISSICSQELHQGPRKEHVLSFVLEGQRTVSLLSQTCRSGRCYNRSWPLSPPIGHLLKCRDSLWCHGAGGRQCSSPSRPLPISFCADSLRGQLLTELRVSRSFA